MAILGRRARSRASLVAGIHQSDRRGGEDGGLLAGDEAIESFSAKLIVVIGSLYVIPGAKRERQVVFDLPLVLEIQVVLVGSGINHTSGALTIRIRDAQQEIGTRIAGRKCAASV